MKKATTTTQKTKSSVEDGKEGGSPALLIDARIKELSDWRGKTLARLRILIKQADPEVVEEVKCRKPSETKRGRSSFFENKLRPLFSSALTGVTSVPRRPS